MSARRALLILLCAALPLSSTGATGEELPAPDPDLSADDVYERVLENRFDASVQELALVSGDRGGHQQSLRVQMLWRRYAAGSPDAAEGVLSRTLLRYLEPGDLRGAGYLIINKRHDPGRVGAGARPASSTGRAPPKQSFGKGCGPVIHD